MSDAAPSRPSRPSIGVAGDHFPAPLIQLLGELGRWCHVMALTADVTEAVDAVVVRGPCLIGALRVVGARPRRVAVWVETLEEMDHPALAEADLVISDRPAVVEKAAGRGLLAPTGGENSPGQYVAPHVRSRLRAAHRLPVRLMVEHDGDAWMVWPGGRPLAPEFGETALACASVAVATAPGPLLAALSWGTPSVTDDESAAAVSAQVGRHVLVGDAVAERRRTATVASDDPTMAARLSWWGRNLVETRHSPNRAAASLVRRLGLGPASPHGLPDSIAARLGEFETPTDSVVATRVQLAIQALTNPR